MKCCLLCCKYLHVPVTDYYTVLDAWMRMFSLYYKKVREHMQHCLSLCWENSTHRSIVWMCNQALNKNHDKETSVISVHLRSCLIYYCIQWFRLTNHLLILCLKSCMCEKIQNICWLSIPELMNHILEHSRTVHSPRGTFNCPEVAFSQLRRLGLDCSVMLNVWITFARCVSPKIKD